MMLFHSLRKSTRELEGALESMKAMFDADSGSTANAVYDQGGVYEMILAVLQKGKR